MPPVRERAIAKQSGTGTATVVEWRGDRFSNGDGFRKPCCLTDLRGVESIEGELLFGLADAFGFGLFQFTDRSIVFALHRSLVAKEEAHAAHFTGVSKEVGQGGIGVAECFRGTRRCGWSRRRLPHG